MKPQQEAERFLTLAFADRDAAVALGNIEAIHPNIICFHAQQAVEKALKAVLLTRQIPVHRTHDLSECAYQIQDLGLLMPVPVEVIAKLTPYAVTGRYGAIVDEIVSIDEAIGMMIQVTTWASSIVTPEK